MRNQFLKLLCFLICIPTISKAQLNLSPTLKQAITTALENNNTIKNNKIKQEQNRLKENEVLNKYIPQISANSAYSYINNTMTLDIPTLKLPISGYQLFEGTTSLNEKGNIFLAGINVQQIVFSGGQIIYGNKALNAKNEGNDLINELEKDKIVKDVINSFDQLKLIHEGLKLIAESETRLLKEKQRVETAIQHGLAVPYDRDKIELAQLNLNTQKEDILGKQQLLLLKLMTITGYDSNQINTVEYDFEPIYINNDLGISNRNELKALNAYESALQYNLKKEKGSLLPNIGLIANYSYTSFFNSDTKLNFNFRETATELKLNQATLSPNWIIGIAVKWNILDGLERRHKIEAVKLDQQILTNNKEDANKMMQLQLENNKVMYQTALNKINISKQREKIALNNLNTAEKQYKLGLISITERLASETEIYESSLQNVQNIINQRQAALEVYSASELLVNKIY